MQELVVGLNGRRLTVAYPEEHDLSGLGQHSDRLIHLLLIQKLVGLVNGLQMALQYLLEDRLLAVLFFAFLLALLMSHIDREPHLKLLVALCPDGTAEAVHRGVRHMALLRQLRNRHEKNLLGVFLHIVGNFLLGSGQLVIRELHRQQHIRNCHKVLLIACPIAFFLFFISTSCFCLNFLSQLIIGWLKFIFNIIFISSHKLSIIFSHL